MCQSGNCSKCNRCGCGEDMQGFFVKNLPVNACPHSFYFVKSGDDAVSTYVTNKEGVPYPISGGVIPSDINIISPNDTISVSKVGNTFRIDVKNSQGGSDRIKTITFNGDLLPVDSNFNVDINAVESVTGNLVDNTDPFNPKVNFDPSQIDLEDFKNDSSNPYLRESDLGIIDHNSTSNKQGGDEDDNEFYHLTENEHNYLVDIVDNDTIGKILEVIAVPPTYVAPTASINNVAQVAEVGSTITINITQTFNQNDAGAKTSESILKNGVSVSTSNTYSENLTVQTTQTVYSGTVSYAEGATKNNNLGIPDPTGKILTGTVNSANRVITPIYPVFYGVFSTAPDPSALDFTGMTKLVAQSNGTVTITPNSNSNQFVVVAIPTSSTIKTKWYISELNKGDIGGSVNLFGTPSTTNKNSPQGYWESVSYKIYITNYKSAINTIELRNS